MIYLLAVMIGVVAGLRAMTAPAAVSIGAWLGLFSLAGTPLALMGSCWAAILFALLAFGELVTDQFPRTPSRKVPMQFGARLLTGGLSGASIGALAGVLVPGLIAGIAGAVLGTYGGAAFRAWLAGRLGRDLPAGLAEDLVAIGGAAVIIGVLSRPL
jgi:uncharacterized membrane protein